MLHTINLEYCSLIAPSRTFTWMKIGIRYDKKYVWSWTTGIEHERKQKLHQGSQVLSHFFADSRSSFLTFVKIKMWSV